MHIFKKIRNKIQTRQDTKTLSKFVPKGSGSEPP